MKGLHYEQISKETHRVLFNYQTLCLSQQQEAYLQAVLNGPAKRGFGLGVNCIITKDKSGRITVLDFKNKELAHHFLLFVEMELIDIAKADELERRSPPIGASREEGIGMRFVGRVCL